MKEGRVFSFLFLRAVRALADALQGLVVSEGAIHDADGRLVLDRDGGFDPRAFAPRSLLVFGDLEGKHRVSRGRASDDATRQRGEDVLRAPDAAPARGEGGLARLQKIVTSDGPVVELTGDGPHDVDAVLRRAPPVASSSMAGPTTTAPAARC